MNEPVYTISQASALVGRKSYVLRYWEDELSIPIARNEMGHRYYTGKDIQLFLSIRELQRRGLQLKAIRELVPQLYCQAPGRRESPIQLLPPSQDANRSGSHKEHTSDNPHTHPGYIYAGEAAATQEERAVDEYKIQQFMLILHKLMSQTICERRARDREASLHILDDSIRSRQKRHSHAAATAEMKKKRRKKKKWKESL